MAFSPRGTMKVTAGPAAQTIARPDNLNVTNPGALIANAGPSLVFVGLSYRPAPADAEVDGSMPVFPGTQVVLPVPAAADVSLVSEGTAVVYVTFGAGELSGLSLRSTETP